MEKNEVKIAPGMGVRKLSLADQLPDCGITINGKIYELAEICRNKNVVDIGCGYGRNRKIVEDAGGKWTGVEPFEGGAHTVVADAEDLPFENDTFDVAIMDAVLEHIPDVSKAIAEVARVLKPGGVFIGYVAFMECFHEISYSHLSFKALEHFSKVNNMKLEKISGGHRFGIDYHRRVLFYPIPMGWSRPVTASMIRGIIRIKSFFAYLGLRYKRKLDKAQAKKMQKMYFQLECLRQSVGFNYIIRKNS